MTYRRETHKDDYCLESSLEGESQADTFLLSFSSPLFPESSSCIQQTAYYFNQAQPFCFCFFCLFFNILVKNLKGTENLPITVRLLMVD